jgi:phosphoglycerate kinase
MKSLKEISVREKRVFLRTDFNVPMENGKITDTTRIEAALPTIKYLLERNVRLIIASHLGRPNGEKNPDYSMEPVAVALTHYLDTKIIFFEDSIGMGVQQMVRDLKPGNILVLENLRFYKAEKKNEQFFARELAKLADVYVNDAFGVSHRKNASVFALPEMVEDKAAGFLIEKEVKNLSKLFTFKHGDKFTAIIGGAKVSDKIGLLKSLLDNVDSMLIGGAMAYTFLAAKGINVGKSLVEKDKISIAKDILKGAEARKVEIELPIDHIISTDIDSIDTELCDGINIPDKMMGFDIGPKTIEKYSRIIRNSKAIFWNGPMGVFEKEQFAKGSMEIAKSVALSEAYSVAGGGDSVAMIKKAGVSEKINHISTGGGASLEFIQNKTLPCIELLK